MTSVLSVRYLFENPQIMDLMDACPTPGPPPAQSISFTPDLFDDLVAGGSVEVARRTLSLIPEIKAGSVVHDIGCGTGVVTEEIIKSQLHKNVTVHATDDSEMWIGGLEAKVAAQGWENIVKPAVMATECNSFPDKTFSHVFMNAILTGLDDEVASEAGKNIYRTLKPGGTAVVTTWNVLPHDTAMNAAHSMTRPNGTARPMALTEEWKTPSKLVSTCIAAGFSEENVTISQHEFYADILNFDHWVNLAWSYLGQTNKGWLDSDNLAWDQQIAIIKRGIICSEGFYWAEGGRPMMRMVANIAVATK